LRHVSVPAFSFPSVLNPETYSRLKNITDKGNCLPQNNEGGRSNGSDFPPSRMIPKPDSISAPCMRAGEAFL